MMFGALLVLFGLVSLGQQQNECKDPSNKPLQCDPDDCSKLWFCDGTDTADVDCTGGTPYCTIVPGGMDKCTSTKDPSNPCTAAPNNPFKCPFAGYFPDPYSCHVFHMCYTKDPNTGDVEDQEEHCSDLEYFDSKAKTCKTIVYPAQCYVVDCDETPGQSAYKPNPTEYYHICFDPTKIIMLKCVGEVYHEQSGSCVFLCPGVGIFPNKENRSIYYECKSVGEVITDGSSQRKVCPNGLEFDPVQKKCILKF